MREHPWYLNVALGLVLIFSGASTAADLPGTGEDAGKTVLYRDTWGVAHIYAPTVEAGLYAQGWAQAEDRPEALLENFARALGESAKFEGRSGIRQDLVVRMFDHYGAAKRGAGRGRPEVRAHVRAYVQGINDFYAAHPQDVPDWWGDRKVDEYMVVAFGRLFLYGWSTGQAFSDLRRGGISPGFDKVERGSNQWSVSPARSAVDAAILYIDPHLSWWGASRFWEFRIHAGELHGSGVTLPASPYIGLGHNANVAWAMTTGGPDTADIYALTLKDDDPTQYLYDGEYRQMTTREVTIEVKGAAPHTATLYGSHYGPIVALRGGKAYAARMSYADAVEVNDAWYEFNFAKDYKGAVAAMDTLMLFPQNVMVADTSGNIYYQRTGRVPKRPSGYDWNRPVDGSTSATEWQGLHPASDHVQLLNPPQGYMQNCNISPDVMMVDSPLTPDKYPSYIYGSGTGRINQRGSRAIELLQNDDSVTIEEALAYAVDVRPAGIDRWMAVLKQIDDALGAELRANPDYVAGMDDLLAWNRELRRDSPGALKYYYWRKQLTKDYGEQKMGSVANRISALMTPLGQPAPDVTLNEEELQAAAASFESAMATLKSDHGSLDAVYGDTFRVGRDDESWPLGGGGGNGLTTLRNVSYGRERNDHTRWGRSGQTSTQICVMTKPVQSWMYLPIGNSDRPDSPHYRDQAAKCFSGRQLKPTWWLPEDLAEHIESRTVLEHAP
ncbi:MAG: hypothetical protein GWP08_17950 [Nitrospiraceae bacterium]|nr:hypothetical protein [Nitrospiraceae bacterium]